jgi:hypothetical protein
LLFIFDTGKAALRTAIACEVSLGRLVATSNLKNCHQENLFGRRRKLGFLSVEKGGHGSRR